LKPILLIAESQGFSPNALEILSNVFQVECADLDQAGLKSRIKDVNCLWVRLRNYIDRSLIVAAPKLKVIATNTTGLNHIDLKAAAENGIEVVSLRGEVEFLKSIRATAELTIALTLAVLRNLHAAHEHVLAGGWDRVPFKGREIFEKTVGIVGYGRLGSIVAGYFRAFGANVLICDPKLVSQRHVDGFEVRELHDLLAESEIVSLHANYTPANEGFFGRAQFQAMRPDSIFINTARGELVDEAALVEALQEKRLAGAALDVISSEHDQSESLSKLRELARKSGNIILTPHIGGNTFESLSRTEGYLAQKLIRWAGANL
jgi:D-3-phosphoglycerate dehydrogenase / 2-oxoglutarate reductase